MAKNYIKADELCNYLVDHRTCDIFNYANMVNDSIINALLEYIDKMPEPDVVERKKGKWIDRSAYCVCNLCGHTEQQFNGVQPIPRHTPFCATCGAEMEETDG